MMYKNQVKHYYEIEVCGDRGTGYSIYLAFEEEKSDKEVVDVAIEKHLFYDLEDANLVDSISQIDKWTFYEGNAGQCKETGENNISETRKAELIETMKTHLDYISEYHAELEEASLSNEFEALVDWMIFYAEEYNDSCYVRPLWNARFSFEEISEVLGMRDKDIDFKEMKSIERENQKAFNKLLEFAKEVQYKQWTIYEQEGMFTVGGADNSSFEDCTLENLRPKLSEIKMVCWCKDSNVNLTFEDLRGDKSVSFNEYLEHLEKYKTEKDNSFIDNEFIVPIVRFKSIEAAKEFLDWMDKELIKEDLNKSDFDLESLSAQMKDDGVTLEQIAEELNYREMNNVQEGMAGWDDSLCIYSTERLSEVENFWIEREEKATDNKSTGLIGSLDIKMLKASEMQDKDASKKERVQREELEL